MQKTFSIQWTSKVSGRAGRGTRIFTREEAERLAEELNHTYPEISHEIVEVSAEPPSDSKKTGDAKALASDT